MIPHLNRLPAAFRNPALLLMTGVLASAILFAGCCKDCFIDSPFSEDRHYSFDGSRYFPLDAGNSWSFEFHVGENRLTFEYVVYDTISWNGLPCAFVDVYDGRSAGSSPHVLRYLYRFGNDTLLSANYLYEESRRNLTVSSWIPVMILNPNRKGAEVESPSLGFGRNYMVVGETIDNVHTAKGDFSDCLVINFEYEPVGKDRIPIQTTYFAPDVGPVGLTDYPYGLVPGDLGSIEYDYTLFGLNVE